VQDPVRQSLWLVVILSFFAVWATCASAQTVTPAIESLTTPTPCPTCWAQERLSVGRPALNPVVPAVGDLVELTFAISSSGHQPPEFSCPCAFEADASLLEGDEPPQSGTHTVSVRRRAVRAGVVTVVLHVAGWMEHLCYPIFPMGGGCSGASYHKIVDASSPPFDLQLVDAPTPTATPTPTPTRTETAVTATPTPAAPAIDPSPTCREERVWWVRELPREATAGIPFTVTYRFQRSGTVTRVTETVPAGWQVLSPPWSEHSGDTYIWKDTSIAAVIWEIEVLPPAGAPTGDYWFSGSTFARPYGCSGGGRSWSIEGDSRVHLSSGASLCVGDCSGDRRVTVDELVLGVNIALGIAPLADCSVLDNSNDERVTVGELVDAIGAALSGCP
jgi:hypothetical protein